MMGTTAVLTGYRMQEICIAEEYSQEIILRVYHDYRTHHGASCTEPLIVRRDEGGTVHRL